jgi:hypothetical protein
MKNRSLNGVAESAQLGANGARITSNSSSELEVQNAAGDSKGHIKVAPATHADHAITKAQLDAVIGGADGAFDTLKELQTALGDDANFASTVTNLIAALQADVDQNEADSDAAELALQKRATALETFKALVESGLSFVDDNGNTDVVVDHDLNVNKNIMSNGTQIFNQATMQLKNIAAIDATTKATFAVDAAERYKIRHVVVSGAGGSAETSFGTALPANTQVVRIAIKVTQAFDAGSTLTIGHTGSPAALFTLATADMQNVDLYIDHLAELYASGGQLVYQVNGASTGSAEVSVSVAAY